MIYLLQNVRNMLKLARSILQEVNSIRICLTSLQKYVDGTFTVPLSRTSLMLIDGVRVVLSDCLIKTSESWETIDRLRLNQ